MFADDMILHIENCKDSTRKLLELINELSGWQETVGNSSREETTWPASWKICMKVKKQQLEMDMEQQSASK